MRHRGLEGALLLAVAVFLAFALVLWLSPIRGNSPAPTPWLWYAPSPGPVCVVYKDHLGVCYDPKATP